METPFTINISAEQIAELKLKLSVTRLPDELEDAERKYGPRLEDIKRLLSRWMNGYDWKEHEAQLNAELPQFTRPIDVDGYGTLDIHYVHKKSMLETAIPLLFVHGCRCPPLRRRLPFKLTILQGQEALWKSQRYCHC